MAQSPLPTVNERLLVPDLKEYTDRRLRDISYKINCHTIGTIKSYSVTNLSATVSINFQRTIRGANPLNNVQASSDIVIDYPLLVNVPIVFLNGGGAYLTFPIAPGDTCLVMFCDRDIDNWLQTGAVSPPNSDRAHDLNDAVALVGLRNSQKSNVTYDPNVIQLSDITGERLLQSGMLMAYAGSSAPSGWLLCYGQAISKTSYAILFSVIGTTYGGSGDNFNLPDLRGRVPVALDNMGGSNANVLTNTYNPNRDTLGGDIGEEAHTLIISELASHNHDGIPIKSPVNISGSSANQWRTDSSSTAVTANTGNDTPHQNVQPGIMMNWIIKI